MHDGNALISAESGVRSRLWARARRHQFLAALTNRLRARPVDSGRLVPLDEIVGSLGWRGQRQLGLQTIRLDTIVGTTGARRDFDRCFRPTSGRARGTRAARCRPGLSG